MLIRSLLDVYVKFTLILGTFVEAIKSEVVGEDVEE